MDFGKKGIKIFIILLLGFGLGFFCVGCWSTVPPQDSEGEDNNVLYSKDIVPLKPDECGQCHQFFYELLRKQGGKHKVDCKRCHVQFHNGEDLPECATCHESPHVEELANCLECHSEVHSPLDIPASRVLGSNCYICHAEADMELKSFITRHSELYCSSCHHTQHRYIPQCRECHQPHAKEMTQAECLSCHLPHKALDVEYSQDTAKETCAICHPMVYDMLVKSATKHAVLQCTLCHPEKHRAIKRCRECHETPHDQSIHQKTKVCGKCHGIAHNVKPG